MGNSRRLRLMRKGVVMGPEGRKKAGSARRNRGSERAVRKAKMTLMTRPISSSRQCGVVSCRVVVEDQELDVRFDKSTPNR